MSEYGTALCSVAEKQLLQPNLLQWAVMYASPTAAFSSVPGLRILPPECSKHSLAVVWVNSIRTNIHPTFVIAVHHICQPRRRLRYPKRFIHFMLFSYSLLIFKHLSIQTKEACISGIPCIKLKASFFLCGLI